MATLSDILAMNPAPNDRKRRKPRRVEITEPLPTAGKKPDMAYESAVFNHLLANKESLGIRRINQLKNQRMDGELELVDGRLVAIEIKYRMNWLKACQSGSQLRTFLNMSEEHRTQIKAAIVFFEEFSGDWSRKMNSHATVLGWVGWYNGHHLIDGIPFQLIRFRGGRIETYEDDLNTAAPSGLRRMG